MRIQVLLLWGFVFIYLALMNMNLPLDREAAVPLRTLHIDFPHPDLPPPRPPRPRPPTREVGDRLSSTRLQLSRFLLDFSVELPGSPNATPPPQAHTRGMWMLGAQACVAPR